MSRWLGDAEVRYERLKSERLEDKQVVSQLQGQLKVCAVEKIARLLLRGNSCFWFFFISQTVVVFLAASRVANAGSKRAPRCCCCCCSSSSSGEDKTFRTRLFYIHDPDLLKYETPVHILALRVPFESVYHELLNIFGHLL